MAQSGALLDDLFGSFGGVDNSGARGDDNGSNDKDTKKVKREDGGDGEAATETTDKDGEEKVKSEEEEEEKKKKAEEEQKIATGTSHDKSVRSYSCYPVNYKPLSLEEQNKHNDVPAKTYPYKLDPFQSQSIHYIEKLNESVLVAAHTSAGKTTVAEYAIAKCIRDGQRAIYTSPIKALSNQKYRDLQEEFGVSNVGLMTGDITIHPTAQVLVMTTEILRSMLYRGSEVMREVAWVIYDEVHYMRDKERGVVWEESIILLPHRVRFVFLSATIPNSQQFAQWIAKIHHQPCHVLYTNYRPVPLQHYIFPQGGDGLYLVVDERGRFRETNFQKAMAKLQASTGGGGGDAGDTIGNSGAMGKNLQAQKRKRKSGGGAGGGGGKEAPSDLHRIVKLVMDRGLNPVIIFSFSKKDCETYALQLKRQDFNTADEKELIGQVFHNAMEQLSEEDRSLPQVEALLPLLKRGIGIHHGGLLSILKEIVEILFSEGLIKVLFATETFSIGINMPAKTVVFTSTRKWDGTDFRWVTSGEYIQMSGRAGRRGKDDRGIVIQMMDESIEPDISKGILYGDPDPLNSSYHIRYHMLLNMMRVEDVDPQYLLRASFHQFQQEDEAPALHKTADELEEQMQTLMLEHDKEKEAESAEEKSEKEIKSEKTNSNENDKKGESASTTAQKETKPDANAMAIDTETATTTTATSTVSDDDVRDYFDMKQQVDVIQQKIMAIVRRPEHVLPFLTAGRLISVKLDNGKDYGWGAIVSVSRVHAPQGLGSSGKAGKQAQEVSNAAVQERKMEVLLPCRPVGALAEGAAAADSKTKAELFPWKGSSETCDPAMIMGLDLETGSEEKKTKTTTPATELRVFSVEIDHIQKISAVRIFIPQDVNPEEPRQKVLRSLTEVQKRFASADAGGVPLLDNEKDLGISSEDYHKLIKRAKPLEELLTTHIVQTQLTDLERTDRLKIYSGRRDLLEQIKAYRQKAKACQIMVKKEELKTMKKVLKHLDHVDANGVITTKGRTACEVNTSDELVVVEMMFAGVFNDISVEQAVALLSCMTYDEKSNGADSINDVLKAMKSFLVNPFLKLQEAARTVARAQIACKVPKLDEQEFVDNFRPDMMEAVFAWCKGASFADVQQLTNTYEGTTIRTLRRLEELVRQLAAAAKAVGNHELNDKFTQGSELIKRDIVFCSSLYL
jgi:ATP-dependent RNA helicase DOB1